MNTARFCFYASCLAVALSAITGCFVIRGTSVEWRKDKAVLAQEGPGTSEGTLYRWQNNKVEFDNGNRIAIGLFPGLAQPNVSETVTNNIVLVCFGNGVLVGIPTVFNLVFGPFSEIARKSEVSALTLFGCYEWEESSHETILKKDYYDDIIVMAESCSTLGKSHRGNTHDGTKLYFSYPGNDVIKKDIASFGKAAVMFDYPVPKYRLFYPAKEIKGSCAFKDVDVNDDSFEMTQFRYYNRVETAKASASNLIHNRKLRDKAQTAIRSLDELLVALPKIDEATLACLEKEVYALNNMAYEIDAEEMRAAKERELLVMRRKAAENGWRHESDLRDFALKESPSIWQVVQQVRAEVKARKKAIAQLRADLKLFGKNPDNDQDCQNLNKNVDVLLDSLVKIFLNLENAYIASKKYEASPSRKDYQDTMKRALEDGIQDANMATERYKAMTRQK